MIQKLRHTVVSAEMVWSSGLWHACKIKGMQDTHKQKKWAVNLSDTGVLLSRICTLVQEVFMLYRTSAMVVPAVKPVTFQAFPLLFLSLSFAVYIMSLP